MSRWIEITCEKVLEKLEKLLKEEDLREIHSRKTDKLRAKFMSCAPYNLSSVSQYLIALVTLQIRLFQHPIGVIC